MRQNRSEGKSSFNMPKGVGAPQDHKEKTNLNKEKSRYRREKYAAMAGKRSDTDEKNDGQSRENARGKSYTRDKSSLGHKPAARENSATFRSRDKDGCPYAKKCGGCAYQGMNYDFQLQRKKDLVTNLLEEFCRVRPIIGMEKPYHYRHKVHAAFGYQRGKGVVAGVYKSGTHQIVDIENCLIENEKADAIIRDIKGMMDSFKIKTYDEDTGYGLLRHVLIRCGHQTGQIMVVLVLSTPILPSKNNFVKALRDRHPEIETVVVNVNNKRTSMVLGEKETAIYGKGYIEDVLCGKTFRISPSSFYQVNPAQTEILYKKALEMAQLNGTERVIDAYCGTGTIGIIAADQAKEVIGVEVNKDAVKDAIINARRNEVKNISFYQEDAGKFMRQMMLSGDKADVVIMDPPRSGSSDEFLTSLAQLKPKKIVYISCNPETQARDLRYLVKNGYLAKEAVPVDLFPFTEHVETVVLLSQRKADNHIEVDLDLDGLDVTSAESKATYNEIQQYVLKETGLMVSNLYIAQIKKKCGIDVGECFNKPKTENAKQPKCPEDKEKAIKDALKHFGMI